MDVRKTVVKNSLDKYVNVVGYSNHLMPRIRRGVVIREEKCIRVYVRRKVPEDKLPKDQILPKKVLDDTGREVCVDVVEIGNVRKLDTYKDRYRPAPCGVSTSRLDEVSAGTIGWWVIDEDLNTYVISNNHVWAKENQGNVGDPVIQPGRFDGGNEDDVIGYLAGFVPISFSGGVNYVDLAWVECSDLTKCYASIMGVGGVVGARDPIENEVVKKVGRTTGITSGSVTDDSVTIYVDYDSGSAVFTDVFVVSSSSKISGGGDSGSPVIGPDGRFLGLLFAGNDDGTLYVASKYSRIVQFITSQIGKGVDVLKVNTPPPFSVRTEYVYVSDTGSRLVAQLLYAVLPFVMFAHVVKSVQRDTG